MVWLAPGTPGQGVASRALLSGLWVLSAIQCCYMTTVLVTPYEAISLGLFVAGPATSTSVFERGTARPTAKQEGELPPREGICHGMHSNEPLVSLLHLSAQGSEAFSTHSQHMCRGGLHPGGTLPISPLPFSMSLCPFSVTLSGMLRLCQKNCSQNS